SAERTPGTSAESNDASSAPPDPGKAPVSESETGVPSTEPCTAAALPLNVVDVDACAGAPNAPMRNTSIERLSNAANRRCTTFPDVDVSYMSLPPPCGRR